MDTSEARRLFKYNPETGDLTHIVGNKKRRPGSMVGWPSTRGVLNCVLDGKTCKVHRLIWLIVYGEWPLLDIDHINRNPSDNRIANLRLATDSQNLGNMCKPCTNKSGKKGVSWHAIGKKWQAHIRVDGTNFYLGLFDTVDEAHAAYMAKAIECRGEFARAE